MKYTVLPECPQMWLTNVITNGHWTNPTAEAMAPAEDGTPEHLHFYCAIDTARALWPQIKHLVPSTIKTVSFDRPELEHCYGCDHKRAQVNSAGHCPACAKHFAEKKRPYEGEIDDDDMSEEVNEMMKRELVTDWEV
jgi:hypothetical protein